LIRVRLYSKFENRPRFAGDPSYPSCCLEIREVQYLLLVWGAPRDSIAGILIEPGLAEGGNWIPTPAFMRGIPAYPAGEEGA